jgi:hypothetical protein
MMDYLAASEYEAFGLDATTAESWVTAASALIDAHCRRSTLGVAQYVERARLSAGCITTRLTFLPLAVAELQLSAISKLRVRYGAVRRSESSGDLASDVAAAFGLPGTWTEFPASAVDVDALSGELTIPTNPLGLSFNEIEVTYTAGLSPIPDAVKVACAQIVRNAQAMPALNVRSNSLDRMHMEYFSDSLLDANVRKLLAQYVAQKVA